jgi:hypothetical protein
MRRSGLACVARRPGTPARRTLQSDSVSGYAARPFFAIFILATTFVLMNVVVGFLLGPAGAARFPIRAVL